MKAYLVSFVEKPHPAFNNLPVCPFAKKARIDNKLLYVVINLDDVDQALREVAAWEADPRYQAIILVDPRKEFPLEEFDRLADEFQSKLIPGLSLFTAHPKSEFEDRHVRTRQEPYPNWQVMRVSDLARAKEQLGHSRWYDHG